MNLLTPITYALAVSSLSAATDFIPSFNDKAVPPERIEAIQKALPQAAIVTPKKARRVLVFSATAGFRHSSIPDGKIALEKLGKATGAYEALISDDPANFEAEALKGFDAVVLLSPTRDFFMPKKQKGKTKEFSDSEWADLKLRHNRLVDNLIGYVKQGGGLVGIHAASDSCYRHSGYMAAIGGCFDGHPWTKDSNVTIVVEDPEHATMKPVFEGIDDFKLVEEIYQYRQDPYSRDNLRILLHLDPERSDDVKGKKREDNDYAVAWVQAVGKGRVFYTNIGHNEHIYANPLMLKHYLAGIQFATGDIEADTTPSSKLDVPNVKHTDSEWVSLFDGKSLKGWTQRDGKATYEVRDGSIVGRSVLKSRNSYLCTDETYGDFELEFEVKCGKINSGVQIRSLQNAAVANGHVQGPQVEIEPSPGQTGYIYGEAYSSWRSPEPKSKDPNVKSHRLLKNDEWNHCRILAKGSLTKTWINGELVADLDDPESFERFPSGMIGLQVHSHKVADIEIEWRKIRIREAK